MRKDESFRREYEGKYKNSDMAEKNEVQNRFKYMRKIIKNFKLYWNVKLLETNVSLSGNKLKIK